ncbi:MAG TPA: hypothetical protein ENJ20_05880 [Bacteroidetes bacterium]|nr:hypothetical protein [Bacteroidota bacterium]
MMNKFATGLFFLFVLISTANAQVLNDAVRYSLLDVGGSARFVGVGGSMGALGADFSVLSTNPAGAAAFRRSRFVFTPAFEFSSSDARLTAGDNNPEVNDTRARFNFNNIGVVFSGRPLSSKWRTAVFGIGLNRVATFHQKVSYEGTSFGSITDRWWELAGTLPPEQLDAFEAGVAFDAAALYDYDPQLGYLTDFLDDQELPGSFLVDKSQEMERKGSINELVFTYAANYDEKIMIGATLGLPILNFEETKIYSENDDPGRVPFFDELEFTENLTTKGAGINLKLGLIYRMSQMVRLGAAIHSPTSFSLEDNFSTALSYRYEDSNGTQRLEANSPAGGFEYRLRTPWRFIGSGGVIIGKQGFLSAEIEYVDYTNASFNFNNTAELADLEREEELNTEIHTQLQPGINIRFGGEYALQDFRLRAGYALNASPFANTDEKNGSLSLGAGYSGKDFFADLAFKYSSSESEYRPYLLSLENRGLEQPVHIKEQQGRLLLTIGFKF